jgi:phage-related holin
VIIVFLMLVLEKNQVAGLASAKIRRINIRKGYKDYRKKLPTKAAIVVSRSCFNSILHPSCRRVCGGGRRFFSIYLPPTF